MNRNFKFGKDTTEQIIDSSKHKFKFNSGLVAGETSVNVPSDIKETLVELNADVTEKGTNMSSIDFKARITPFEERAMLVIDGLVALNAMPLECLNITRQKKRLSVSRHGEGRKEMIKAIVGNNQADEKKGIFQKIRGFMGI